MVRSEQAIAHAMAPRVEPAVFDEPTNLMSEETVPYRGWVDPEMGSKAVVEAVDA